VYIDSVEPETTVRVVSRLGLNMPTHATAAGKALVLSETEEDLRGRFDHDLKRFTANTIRTFDDLLRNLHAARDAGFATDLEEFEEGLRCVAAPIRDYTRKVIGALSVSGPAHRLTDEKIESLYSSEVMRHARDLSSLLGFRE
jgi:DNA-binding IclR family transcriptional regulator